jgi:hypothetical protein
MPEPDSKRRSICSGRPDGDATPSRRPENVRGRHQKFVGTDADVLVRSPSNTPRTLAKTQAKFVSVADMK